MSQEVVKKESGHHARLLKVLRENSSYPAPSTIPAEDICKEWRVFSSSYDSGASLTCVCGKKDIAHTNVIQNVHTGTILDPIGSECVKNFGIPDLGLLCKCCAKPIQHGNTFVDAYMKSGPIKKDTQIIGHVPCVRKFLSNKWWNSQKWLLGESVTKYFNQLGIQISLDKYGNFDLEYTDDTLTPYVEDLTACL
jgi:hypothetical protein